MIVCTMTEEEMRKEVLSDLENAFRYSDAKDKAFRRMVIKSNKFPVYSHAIYLSPRKNTWLILYEAKSKKETGDNSRVTFVACYNSPHGHYAVMISFINGNNHLVIYPPHFFSRYAMRCGINLSGIDLMLHFFRFNSSYVFDLKQVEVGKDMIRTDVFGSTKDGIAMGYLSVNKNILFKTFITYDMAKGEQIDTFYTNEQIRKEIHGS